MFLYHLVSAILPYETHVREYIYIYIYIVFLCVCVFKANTSQMSPAVDTGCPILESARVTEAPTSFTASTGGEQGNKGARILRSGAAPKLLDITIAIFLVSRLLAAVAQQTRVLLNQHPSMSESVFGLAIHGKASRALFLWSSSA